VRVSVMDRDSLTEKLTRAFTMHVRIEDD